MRVLYDPSVCVCVCVRERESERERDILDRCLKKILCRALYIAQSKHRFSGIDKTVQIIKSVLIARGWRVIGECSCA